MASIRFLWWPEDAAVLNAMFGVWRDPASVVVVTSQNVEERHGGQRAIPA